MLSKNMIERMRKGRFIAFFTLLTLLSVLISALVPEVLSEMGKKTSDGECEECHTGFEPFVTQVDSPTEVPESYEFDFGLLVQNTWSHRLEDIVLTIDLSESSGLEFFEIEPQNPIDETIDGTAPPRGISSGEFMIGSRVEEIRIFMEWTSPILFTGDMELSLIGRNDVWTETSSDEIVIDGDEIHPEDYGPYQWTVSNTGRVRAIDFTIELEVVFSDQTTRFSTPVSSLGPGESGTLKLPLRSINKSENMVSFTLKGVASYDHSEQGLESEEYITEGVYSIEVGDEVKYSKPTGIVSISTSIWILGRVLGFVTVGLFITSFISGGTIKRLKIWIDRRMNNRHRWHCVISFASMVSVIVHLSVLYMGFYSGTWKGLLTGSIPLIFMLIVGITGWKKDRIVEMSSEMTWRRIHLWLSILAILLIVIHAVAEGTDLAFLRWW